MTGEEGYTVVGSEHYTTHRGHGGVSSAVFFLVGCAVGAGLGLLLTPQSGSRTRRQLQEASRETRERMGSYYERARRTMGATLDKGKDLVTEGRPLVTAAVEAGRAAYEREKAQTISRLGKQEKTGAAK